MIKHRALSGLLIVALAVLVAAGGFGAWWNGRAGAAGNITLDGLRMHADEARWISHHDSDSGSGYAMPAQMMPGAPADGQLRLGVPITLANAGSGWRSFTLADEFFLSGTGIGAPLPVRADTFGELTRLGPGSAADGILYFDTGRPAADPHYVLLWRRGGHEERLAVRFAAGPTAAPPGHNH